MIYRNKHNPNAGPSRATAWPGEAFSRNPSGEKIFEFFYMGILATKVAKLLLLLA